MRRISLLREAARRAGATGSLGASFASV
jgi:hypothetical protein